MFLFFLLEDNSDGEQQTPYKRPRLSGKETNTLIYIFSNLLDAFIFILA